MTKEEQKAIDNLMAKKLARKLAKGKAQEPVQYPGKAVVYEPAPPTEHYPPKTNVR